jgi:thiamine biosynthesis protein ThiI
MSTYLIRYAEIALKGKNRKEFEQKLVSNIKKILKFKDSEIKVKRLQGRMLAEADEQLDFSRVFGISSYSPCLQIKAELEIIFLESLNMAKAYTKTSTFRISAHRLTKEFPLSSMELNNKLGTYIIEKAGLKVQLENPNLDLGIEIIGNEAFLFEKTIACFGGLPVGIEGKVLALVSDEKSLLAALLALKRGCCIEVVGLFGPDEQDYSLLQMFSPNKLVLHKVNNLSQARELVRKLECKALIVNDTLNELKEYPSSLDIPVLRPLIAFTDSEINKELEKYKQII